MRPVLAFAVSVPLLVAATDAATERSSFAWSLTADTANATSLFTPGQDVGLTFTATGASGQTLTVTIEDADGNVVATQTAAVSSDPWTGGVTAPGATLGFYRVRGTLTDGTTIAPVGSRAQADGSASFATYAVIPDPSARRATLADDHAFFGLAGGFNVGQQILAQLGVRWIKDSQWSWSAREPNANQRNTFAPIPSSSETGWLNGTQPWVAFSLPNLTVNGKPYAGTPDVCVPNTFAYNTCAVDPSYDGDWTTFAAEVATDWPKVYPSRAHRYYEMTWEPIAPWGFLGTPAELVNLYALAAPAMKKVDPSAIVIGPTMFIEGPAGDADDVLAAGLAQYIDVFSTHPYCINDVGYYGASLADWGYWDPELSGLPSRLATQFRKVAAAAGRAIPTIGTEQGYPTHQQVEYEIDQARRLVRQNLLFLGMGYQSNIAFYFADYPQGVDSQWKDPTTSFYDYGLFYNLDEATFDGYGPTKVSPKPVAAAYAAMTMLLDDRKAVTDVNWLGDTTRGYVYESFDDPSDEVMALWDFGGGSPTVTLDAGVPSVQVYDWMGNAKTVATTGGTLTLTLSGEPTYVKGVAASVWGSARARTNVAKGKAVTTSGDAADDAGVTAPGALAIDGDVWANESRWISTSDANDKWIAVDLGAPVAVDEVRFFTGEYVPAAHANVYGGAPAAYHVQTWNGSAWVDAVAKTANTRAAVDEVFPAVTTSKVRVYFDAGGATTQVKVYEVEVLAETGTGADAGAGASADAGAGADADADASAGMDASGNGEAPGGAEAGGLSGCGCVVTGEEQRIPAAWAAALLGVGLLVRRRARLAS